MTEAVEESAAAQRPMPIIWIARMLPKEDIIPLYSQAALFVCPSVYEPFGIINLEAMACGTPVVASAVGGIKEVVIPEETGLLVPFEPRRRQGLRAARSRTLRPRFGRRDQPATDRSGALPAHGHEFAATGRTLVRLAEHRPADVRLLPRVKGANRINRQDAK